MSVSCKIDLDARTPWLVQRGDITKEDARSVKTVEGETEQVPQKPPQKLMWGDYE